MKSLIIYPCRPGARTHNTIIASRSCEAEAAWIKNKRPRQAGPECTSCSGGVSPPKKACRAVDTKTLTWILCRRLVRSVLGRPVRSASCRTHRCPFVRGHWRPQMARAPCPLAPFSLQIRSENTHAVRLRDQTRSSKAQTIRGLDCHIAYSENGIIFSLWKLGSNWCERAGCVGIPCFQVGKGRRWGWAQQRVVAKSGSKEGDWGENLCVHNGTCTPVRAVSIKRLRGGRQHVKKVQVQNNAFWSWPMSQSHQGISPCSRQSHAQLSSPWTAELHQRPFQWEGIATEQTLLLLIEREEENTIQAARSQGTVWQKKLM